MSTDYEDKEREFLAYLKADTGRDLAAWMEAIKEANLAHRNDIIDWLRQQGFIFSWASWLERIYHNGGRPIYLSEVPPSVESPRRPATGSRSSTPGSHPASSAPPPNQDARTVEPRPRLVLVYSAPQKKRETETAAPQREPSPRSAPPPSEPRETPLATPPAPAANSADPDAAQGLSPEVAALVAKAKAYAPLAKFILRKLSDTLPGTNFQATGNYIACNRPQTFAILLPGPKGVKLGLALAEAPFERHIVAARFSNLSPQPPKSITHMAVLTDARQVDAILMDHLRSADAVING